MRSKTVVPSEICKALRPLMKLSLDQGWRHERTANQHIRWFSPNGQIVHTSNIHGGSEAARVVKNITSQLARAGLVIKEKQIASGECPHGHSLTRLARGEEICERCAATQAIARRAAAEPATTVLGDAIKSALHPEQTVVLLPTISKAAPPIEYAPAVPPAPTLLELQRRTDVLLEVVELVLSQVPTRALRTEQVILQARELQNDAQRSEIAYALRQLRALGKAVNERRGYWQWSTTWIPPTDVIEPFKLPSDDESDTPLEEEEPTVSPPVTGTVTTPTGQLDVAAPTASHVQTASEDMKKLDAALDALASVADIIKRTRDGLAHLEGLRRFLSGG